MAPPGGTVLFFQKCNVQSYFGNKTENEWQEKSQGATCVEEQRPCPGKTSDSGEGKKKLRTDI